MTTLIVVGYYCNQIGATIACLMNQCDRHYHHNHFYRNHRMDRYCFENMAIMPMLLHYPCAIELNYKFDDNHFEHSMKMNSNDKYSTKIKSWDITSKNFTISHESDTTYWCKIVSPSFRSKAHVIRVSNIFFKIFSAQVIFSFSDYLTD